MSNFDQVMHIIADKSECLAQDEEIPSKGAIIFLPGAGPSVWLFPHTN